MTVAKPELIFRIFRNGEFVREERHRRSVIKVGKLRSSHIRLEDDSVSRLHAVIEVTGKGKHKNEED